MPSTGANGQISFPPFYATLAPVQTVRLLLDSRQPVCYMYCTVVAYSWLRPAGVT